MYSLYVMMYLQMKKFLLQVLVYPRRSEIFKHACLFQRTTTSWHSKLRHSSEICCLLIPNSRAKSVPFCPFSKREIIVCLSFIERTDRYRFVDMAVI